MVEAKLTQPAPTPATQGTVQQPATAPAPQPQPQPAAASSAAALGLGGSQQPVAQPIAPAPQPQPVAPAPQPQPQPVAQPVAPAPQPQPVAQPVAPAPQPQPVAQPVAPAPQPQPQPVAQPVAPAPQPQPVAQPVAAEVIVEPAAPAPQPQPVAQPTQAVTVQQPVAPAHQPASNTPAHGAFYTQSGGGIEGEFDSSDVRLPTLKIVNGSGELSRTYNQGTLLLADEQFWPAPDPQNPSASPSMNFVPVKITKQFRENLTQEESNAGVMPRVVSSREEAAELGGTTEWIGGQKPRWSPSATCVFLLEQPEGVNHPIFSHTCDGKQYALVVYYSSGTAYNESAKQIFNKAQFSLKNPTTGQIMLHKYLWSWSVTKKPAGNFTVFVPSIKMSRTETGEELRALVGDILALDN